MHDQGTNHSARIDIFRIVLLYAVFAALWILFSDEAIRHLIGDTATLHLSQTLKGLAFVAVTSVLLYLLLKRLTASAASSQTPIRGATLVDWPRWQLYLFAAAVTLLTFLVRNDIAPIFSERPLMILLLFPIILSAALGGFGPGLFATFIASISLAYFVIPPIDSFEIAQPDYAIQLAILIINGSLVSFLSMMLHDARQREKAAKE